MADSKRYIDWFNKAKSELKSANILLDHDGDYAVVAFLCQQAIEKAYKGFILRHKNESVDGHSLIFLCKKVSEIDGSYKCFLKDSAYINQFYIETRYPADEQLNINKHEAQECIDITKAILDKIIE